VRALALELIIEKTVTTSQRVDDVATQCSLFAAIQLFRTMTVITYKVKYNIHSVLIQMTGYDKERIVLWNSDSRIIR
jgi:uncharacterized protein YvpB